MGFLRTATAVLARSCLGALFLVSGINKILYWKEMENRFLAILGEWQTHAISIEGMQAFFHRAVIWLPLILTFTTFVEIVGSLLLLFGIQEKWGSFLLALLLIPATILTQSFWFAEGIERELQFTSFLKNIAILGGLLSVVLHGANGERRLPDRSISLEQ